MRDYDRFTPLQKKDINNIMQIIRMYRILSPHAFRRLHSYIRTLEKENMRLQRHENLLASGEVVFLN